MDILQYPYSALTEKLRTGELDIIIADAFCEGDFSRHELETRTMFSSPNYIAAAPAVAEKYHGDTLAMLRNECLITNCEADGPSSMDMLHRLLREEFGFVPGSIAQTNSINAQLLLVRAMHGVALVPGFILDAQGQDLARFPLPHGAPVEYRLMKLASNTDPAVMLMFSDTL